MSLKIEYYSGNEKEWDKFILEDSMNGTFLQTRRFINYHHEGKFTDCSVCVRKGNELMAAILACVIDSDGIKTMFAHKGTSFGGLTVSRKIYSASMIDELFTLLHYFAKSEHFGKIYLRTAPVIYQRENTDLIDYFMYKYGGISYSELNYYIRLHDFRDDLTSHFSASKRRDYRYSLKNGFTFRKLETHEEIASFYEILKKNLRKFNAPAVHSLEDLYDLKFNRFNDRIEFYGVFLDDILTAGSMIFTFGDDIIHTQYLCSDEDYLHLFSMDFLIANLIKTALERNMRIFSFGVCTEDQGRYLNFGLSRFKEGFGSVFCINKSYELLIANSESQSIIETRNNYALIWADEYRKIIVPCSYISGREFLLSESGCAA